MKKNLTPIKKKDLEMLMGLSKKQRDTLAAVAAGMMLAPKTSSPKKEEAEK